MREDPQGRIEELKRCIRQYETVMQRDGYVEDRDRCKRGIEGCLFQIRELEKRLDATKPTIRERLDELKSQWCRRLRTAESAIAEADKIGHFDVAGRLRTKAGVIRSMIVELEMEMGE